MNKELLLYSCILLFGVFVSSISQVMLKKAAQKEYRSFIEEYTNPRVIFAYVLFFITTLLSIYAYKVVPLSMGPILEATAYIYVTVFGVKIFKEHFSKKKLLSLVLIIAGIVVYSFG